MAGICGSLSGRSWSRRRAGHFWAAPLPSGAFAAGFAGGSGTSAMTSLTDTPSGRSVPSGNCSPGWYWTSVPVLWNGWVTSSTICLLIGPPPSFSSHWACAVVIPLTCTLHLEAGRAGAGPAGSLGLLPQVERGIRDNGQFRVMLNGDRPAIGIDLHLGHHRAA